MGSWTAAVYTAEQQKRLGVDESGKKVQAAPAPVAMVSSSRTTKCGVVGPAWTRGEMEAPAGLKQTGTFTSRVYTAEQQARLGVDESGNKAAPPEPMPVAITPQYAAALLSSPKLLSDLCMSYFKKYDTNKSGVLELGEIKILCQDLHESLGLSFSNVDDEAIKASITPFSKGAQAQLLAEEFPAWFTMVMQDSISATPTSQEQLPAQEVAMEVKVKSMSGQEELVRVLPSMTIGTLREIAASALDLPVAQTRLAIGEEILPDSAMLEELQIGPDSEIGAVVMNTIQVKRHVYNMRGGAPPYRGYNLVASDEIELLCDETLGNQMQNLAARDGYPGGGSAGEQMYAFQATPSGTAPKKWEGGMNEVEIKPESTAADTFGVDGLVELAVMLPMRGMD